MMNKKLQEFVNKISSQELLDYMLDKNEQSNKLYKPIESVSIIEVYTDSFGDNQLAAITAQNTALEKDIVAKNLITFVLREGDDDSLLRTMQYLKSISFEVLLFNSERPNLITESKILETLTKEFINRATILIVPLKIIVTL